MIHLPFIPPPLANLLCLPSNGGRIKHPFSAAIHSFGRCANACDNRLRSDPEKIQSVVVGSSQRRCKHSCDTGCIRDCVFMGFMGNTPPLDCFFEESVCNVRVALYPRIINLCLDWTKGSMTRDGNNCGGIRFRRNSASTCVSFNSDTKVSAHACAVCIVMCVKFWRWRSRRSASGMVRASSSAAAMSFTFHGLTNKAPAPSDCAAPANSDNTNTPAFLDWHATNS